MATLLPIKTAWDTHLVEWDNMQETDGSGDVLTPWTSFPDHPEMSVQLMAVAGSTPTIVVEWSLNLHEDSTKVVAIANDMDGTPISLVVAGDGALIRESGILMRLRVSGGTSVIARGRIKFTRTR